MTKPAPRKRIDIFVLIDTELQQAQAYVATSKRDKQLAPYKQVRYYPTYGQIDLYLHYKHEDGFTDMALDMLALSIARNYEWRLKLLEAKQ